MAGSTTLDDKVQALTREITVKRGEVGEAWARFDALRGDLAGSDDVSDENSAAFRAAHEAHMAYGTAADALAALESRRDSLYAMTVEGGAAIEAAHGKSAGAEASHGATAMTWGQRAVQLDAYTAAVRAGVLESFRNTDVRFGEVANQAELHALITGESSTSAGAFVTPDRRPLVGAAYAPLFLTDLVTVGQTGSDLIEYVREIAFTNNAAPVAEATKDGPVSATAPIVTEVEAGVKPQSSAAFEVIQDTVKTIAHWVPVTRRALADAPQMRSYIDGRLRYGVQETLQVQMIQGSGTGENLRGLLNTPGVQSQSKGSDPMVDALHKAMTKVRLAHHEPTAVGIHPNDWEAVRLAKNTAGDYYYGPPALAGAVTVWGLPVAVQAAFPQGNPLVGEFRQAELWLREGVQVLASDSHVDFFTRNIVALLAEMRAGFSTPRPSAFCEVVA